MIEQIQIRRDTAANWTSANPVLALGEPALETDTGNQKIGDGVTAWVSLAYELTANRLASTASGLGESLVGFSSANVYPVGTLPNALASTAAGQGDALLAVKSTLVGSVARTQHDKNADTLCAADFGVLPANPDNTAAWAAAVTAAVAAGKELFVPNGTYVGTITIGASNFKLVGESKQSTILKAKDNSTAVITVSPNSNWVTISNLNVQVGVAGNNGTHYGIYANNTPYLTLESIGVSGFNNNIHILVNNCLYMRNCHSSSPVFTSGFTGCCLYVQATFASVGAMFLEDCHFWSGTYGIYTDSCQAPTLSNCEILLQSNTGFYCCSTTIATYGSGPQIVNTIMDSCGTATGSSGAWTLSGACLYLERQINASCNGLWLSGSTGGKGLVMSNSNFNTFNGLQIYNSQNYGIHISGGSQFNNFGGQVVSGNSIGVQIDTGCTNNFFTGMAVQGNGVNNPAKNNGANPNINWLDTTPYSPNIFIGGNCSNGGGVQNVTQSKDYVTGTNQMNGMMTALTFGQASMAANASGNMSAGVGQFNFVMPAGGSIVAISSSLSGTGVLAGTAAFNPLINGSAALTGSLSLQNNPGATATAASINLQAKGVHFTAGQTVGVSWQTITGTTAGLNAAVTLWVVLD